MERVCETKILAFETKYLPVQNFIYISELNWIVCLSGAVKRVWQNDKSDLAKRHNFEKSETFTRFIKLVSLPDFTIWSKLFNVYSWLNFTYVWIDNNHHITSLFIEKC